MQNKIKELEDKIKYHKELYYSGKAEITDWEYDKLESDLEYLLQQEYYSNNSILNTVGVKEGKAKHTIWMPSIQKFNQLESDLEYLLQQEYYSNNGILNTVGVKEGKAKHTIWMPSIQKFNHIDDIMKYAENKAVTISEKLDGSSIALYYSNGLFERAVTRGDGYIGEDRTEILKNIVVKNFEDYNESVIWAEMVITKSNFIKLQAEMRKRGLEPVKNIRNAVAGLVNRKDNLDLVEMYIDIVAHNFFTDNNAKFSIHSKFLILDNYGFKTPKYYVMETLSLKDFVYVSSQYIKSLENNVYLTDGLVITLNQNNYDLEDKTGHHYRWNCCYKFQSDVKETTILDIIYQVGRTGKITPVASIEPTELSGAIIERVTLHNYKLVKQYKLKKGDKILITRANEVIPKFIDKTFSSDVDFNDLCFCPSCIHPLYISVSGIDLICENPICKDKIIARLLHFVTTHKIDNISTSTIEKMYNDGLFTSDFGFLSFFKMSINDIMRLEGFGEKSANNIIDSIYRVKKNMKATDFIVSLGFPNIGKFVAKKLIEKFGMIENISTSGLNDIEGFGYVIIESIKNNLKYIQSQYEEFKNENIKFVYAENNMAEVKGGVLSGKKFILSGSFSKKKADIETMIKDNGGIILSSVNKELDYLVTNETGTSKYNKAQQLGKSIITEDELLAKIM